MRGQHDGSAAERPAGNLAAIALPGASASIRVWGSHMGVHRCAETTSGQATDERLRRVPGKRKKSKKPLRGGVCLLTKGVLIRVRP